MKRNQKILILSGPTGSGESTLTKKLVEKYPIFNRLVTATSRQIRSGEKDGIDYYFFSKDDFEKLIKSGDILEYSYIENRDTYYGTYAPDLKKKLQNGYVVVNVDYVGTAYYKNNFEAIAIFIKPDDVASLAPRLKKRNPEMSEEELSMRFENAKNEITQEEKYYDVTVINNDGRLDEALNNIENILKENKFIL
jgi:guanylate kinase